MAAIMVTSRLEPESLPSSPEGCLADVMRIIRLVRVVTLLSMVAPCSGYGKHDG